jgi:hypothetical protein
MVSILLKNVFLPDQTDEIGVPTAYAAPQAPPTSDEVTPRMLQLSEGVTMMWFVEIVSKLPPRV